MVRNVIIIGAEKSGTTSLFRYLDEHSRVNTSAGKEPHYFCDRFYEELRSDKVDYEDLWDRACEDIYLEASTGCTKYPVFTGALENMIEYGLNPLFLYIVRSPIDRMLYHAKYMMYKKKSMKTSVEKIRKLCVTTSMYHKQISRYKDVFGRDSLKVVTLNELYVNPGQTVKSIFQFIGVDPFLIERARKENETNEVTRLELAVRKTPVWKLKHFLPDGLKTGIRKFWSLFSRSPEVDVTERIEPETIRRMCHDALRLEDLFDDVDLDPWRLDIARSDLLPDVEVSV